MHLLIPARVHARLPKIMLLVCLGYLAACTSLPQFGKPDAAESAAGGSTPADSHGPEQVYFAGQDNLMVYEEASATSKLIGRLPLHQKVLRSEIRKGYARIRTLDGQLIGWVDNATLIWRLPETAPPSRSVQTQPDASTTAPATAPTDTHATEAQPAASAPAPTSLEAGDSPAPAASTDTAADMPAAETSGDTPEETAEKPKPSVFDSF